MKIVITGGHHTSALPIIHKLKSQLDDLEIMWIGHKYSVYGDKSETLEYKEISALGIDFFDLKAGKLYKTFDPIRLAKIPFGFVQAFYFLLKIKPDVIMSFGGYLAAPVVLAGWVLRIPSLTHEQTVVVGYANKFISKLVRKILVSWARSQKYFPKSKTVLTGLPLRNAIFSAHTERFNVNPDLPTVYITGGKTGSHILNESVYDVLVELLSICNVIHQTGSHSGLRDFEKLEEKYNTLTKTKGKYFLRKHVLADEIGEVYSRCNLVVSRSGAHTTAELVALNKPAVLIPIPWVSHNEQYENARMLQDSGLATILEQSDLCSEKLFGVVKEVLSNIQNFRLKDDSLRNQVKAESASLIVKEILEVAKETKTNS